MKKTKINAKNDINNESIITLETTVHLNAWCLLWQMNLMTYFEIHSVSYSKAAKKVFHLNESRKSIFRDTNFNEFYSDIKGIERNSSILKSGQSPV